MFQQLLKVCIGLICLLSVNAHAAIQGVRHSGDQNSMRFVFDLTHPVQVKSDFILDGPDRLVIDLDKANLPPDWKNDQYGVVKQVRAAQRGEGVRLVFDLTQKVNYEVSMLEGRDPRLVVDINAKQPITVIPVEDRSSPLTVIKADDGLLCNIVVVIDAGHGGHDPGAMRSRSVREKDIVLNIAKELDRVIDARDGYTGVMVRSDDRFVELQDRVKKARSAGADLFISIHADGWKSASARGASVWTLSDRGASSEMGRWLAKHENDAHLLGGGDAKLSLSDKDEMLANVLLDMSMTASRAGSREVAKAVHENISDFAIMHKDTVEQAAFAVLKSPDVPSILVETGFITNPDEARLLSSSRYQKRLAKAIADGVFAYFERKPPVNTYLSEGVVETGPFTYTVKRGDSLSVIAEREKVPLTRLRQMNGLNGDSIWVGQQLKLR